MSCILHAFGSDFDVNTFVRSSYLIADSFWLKGERRFPNSARIRSINDTSGIRIVASEADFNEFHKQVEETTLFLRLHHDEIKRLTSFPGIEGTVLDFGVDIQPPGGLSFVFPPGLLSLSGAVGLSLCLSVYPTETEPED